MKKIRSLVFLLVVTLLLSGCVKYNANMDIKKDKSMDLSITYALDTSVFGETKAFTEEDINNLRKQGYKVQEYSEGTMKGYKLTYSIKNIDDLSSTEDTEFSLSGIQKNGSTAMFKVKKGLLKNTYTAKFSFDSSESGLNTNSTLNSEEKDDDDDETKLEVEEDAQLTDSSDSDSLDLTDSDDSDLTNNEEDYSKMMSNMDLSFSVTLPYKALSNNATSVNNDGKELTWNLASTNDVKSIEFEFELYRFSVGPIITIVAIVIGGLFVIALIVTVIMAIAGGKKPKKEEIQQPTQE